MCLMLMLNLSFPEDYLAIVSETALEPCFASKTATHKAQHNIQAHNQLDGFCVAVLRYHTIAAEAYL